jgi:calcium-dependent protein kinase
VNVYGFKREDAVAEVTKIMKQIDFNETEEIDFMEFVVAATDIDKLVSKKKIEQAFAMFDLVRDSPFVGRNIWK